MLKSKTFTNKELGEFFNKNFISIRIDGDKKEGSELVNKYDISGYPAQLFFDKTGELVHKDMGYVKADEFLKLGKLVLKK